MMKIENFKNKINEACVKTCIDLKTGGNLADEVNESTYQLEVDH